MAQVNRGPPIGIDLGTAYTRVGFFDGKEYKIIPDHNGGDEMPSYVAFTDSVLLVGEAARKQELQNPTNTVFDILRLIGRRYLDPSVQNDMKMWPFKVVAYPNDKAGIEVSWKGKSWQFTPEEILSIILIQIKENTDIYLGTTVTDVVVAIPVCFNYQQRHAVRRAGFIAGLNIIQLITAPAAAGLFYSLQRVSARKSKTLFNILTNTIFTEEYNMVIFDLGAGTFDVSAITLKDDVCEVRATAGDIHLGGKDIDNNMVEHFVNLLKVKDKKDITKISRALIRLRTTSENAKVSLSSGTSPIPLELTPLYNNCNWKNSITRAKFNDLNKHLFTRCIDITKACLKDAKMGRSMVNEVILAGGSTRIPLLQFYLRSYFETEELHIPDHLQMAATFGASIRAFFLSGQKDMRVVPSLSLSDVTPFSLGIQATHGVMSVFIPKNTSIPAKNVKNFYSHHSAKLSVEVYEGEGKFARQNNLLGNFELICSLDNSPKGCEFYICFEIDVNGVLSVTAEEVSGKAKNGITIIGDNSNFLPIEVSQRRVRETFLYKEKHKNGANKASTTMIHSESGSQMWRKMSGKNMLSRITSLGKEKGEYAIGIDFGTTYSSVGVWRQNGVKIIDNEYGKRVTHSCVAFTEAGRLIGDSVNKEQVTTNPANAIYNVKQLIGKRYSDVVTQNDSQLLPYNVTNDKNNRPFISVQYKGANKLIAPEEISSMVLAKMKEIAEAYLGSTVKNAVVSVPACFSDSQRKAIMDAGFIAGLNIMQLINEPTAAAIAYFLQKVGGESFNEKNVLVFDLGGGILDVSVLTISNSIIKVQAVAGDTNLGGETFDDNLVNHFSKQFFKKNKKDMSDKPRSLRRLRTACEKAKRVLSTVSFTMIEIDALYDGIDFRTPITREDFEEINASVFKRCIECVEKCLVDAKMEKKHIHDVILVGGSSRIPKVQQLLQEFFDKELCKSINQDEAVAYGASVQAAVLSDNGDTKKFRGLQIQDVTSLPLALEAGEAMNVIFPKSTSIPKTKELIFTTTTDKQTTFSLNVHESQLTSMSFTLSGILPEPMCYPTIPVVLEIDVNGILNLKTRDESSNKESKIIISKNSCGFNEEEIEKMVENAKVYKEEDEEHKKRAAALNSLEGWAYKMKEIARNVEAYPEDKEHIDSAANDAIIWLDAHQDANIDEIDGQIKIFEHINNELKKAGNIKVPN